MYSFARYSERPRLLHFLGYNEISPQFFHVDLTLHLLLRPSFQGEVSGLLRVHENFQ